MLPVFSFGQSIYNAYFTKDNHLQMTLNPAFQPNRGFFTFPLAGNSRFGITSDYSSLTEMAYALSSDEEILNDVSFYDKMKADSRLDFDLGVDLFSIGWWSGKNFWNVNVGVKGNFTSSIPKSLFEYIRDVNLLYDNDGYLNSSATFPDVNIHNLSLGVTLYSEIGLGYSRQINERITIGGKVKMLLGFMDVDFVMDEMSLEMNLPEYPENPESWAVDRGYGGRSSAQAYLRTAF